VPEYWNSSGPDLFPENFFNRSSRHPENQGPANIWGLDWLPGHVYPGLWVRDGYRVEDGTEANVESLWNICNPWNNHGSPEMRRTGHPGE